MSSTAGLSRLSALFLLFFFFLSVSAKTFTWNCGNSVGTCNNYCYYAKCRSGAKRSFTYDPNKSNARKRRVASGCSKNPCGRKSRLPFKKFGRSCDEFPFASTKEGGKGAQLRCVNPHENSSEGGQLRGFYRKLKPGERYGITIRNYGKARYCARRTCKNDGGQFYLNSNRKFVGNRPRALNDASGFTMNEGNEAPADLKQVETEDGATHLVLAEDPDDPIGAGSQLWDSETDKSHTVVRVL
ncbi:uncharacterized protein CIMG_07064 [Coccidioides immitis RS]|uniref:Deoxyribonuclease NucA/NucB domain-containing protein n=2 Tax=Coccidioides immitis TaxID=5501 RepID=A0A0E1RX19_COCIM|nr:uncharacterized protein CIMG_07064 [Coccidioides immitis RS]EAS31585.2 hypothetical protein CIMG_07064 [Coccidioides immitis RS]KMU87050.1 hypothetical protein CIHG_04990 [Coccidioides immitis H538.4]TPX24337.1 hypothetical protein DIZ76_013683 [Coccidioides immitis]